MAVSHSPDNRPPTVVVANKLEQGTLLDTQHIPAQVFLAYVTAAVRETDELLAGLVALDDHQRTVVASVADSLTGMRVQLEKNGSLSFSGEIALQPEVRTSPHLRIHLQFVSNGYLATISVEPWLYAELMKETHGEFTGKPADTDAMKVAQEVLDRLSPQYPVQLHDLWSSRKQLEVIVPFSQVTS